MNWKKELQQNARSIEEIEQQLSITLPAEEKEMLERISQQFPVSIPRYYLSLIDPEDPEDPIRKLSIPSLYEADSSGSFDTSGEADNTVLLGVQHKYKNTALVLSTNQCAMYCRHCFRKRMVGLTDAEIAEQIPETIRYIREHTEIDNVLLSGGDFLMNSNAIIESYLSALSELDHLDFIRMGSRIPVVYPARISEDAALLELLKKYNDKKTLYLVTHFNHPNEITKESIAAIKAIRNAGITVRNQTVLLKGINDNPDTLTLLFNQLTKNGIIPYYLFQCRPVAGVQSQFAVPLHEAIPIVSRTKGMLNGIAKSFHYAMSHISGKIEIVGKLDEKNILFKYHQAQDEENRSRLFSRVIAPKQCWLE